MMKIVNVYVNFAVIRRTNKRQVDEISADDHLFSIDVRQLCNSSAS